MQFRGCRLVPEPWGNRGTPQICPPNPRDGFASSPKAPQAPPCATPVWVVMRSGAEEGSSEMLFPTDLPTFRRSPSPMLDSDSETEPVWSQSSAAIVATPLCLFTISFPCLCSAWLDKGPAECLSRRFPSAIRQMPLKTSPLAVLTSATHVRPVPCNVSRTPETTPFTLICIVMGSIFPFESQWAHMGRHACIPHVREADSRTEDLTKTWQ